MPEPTTLRALSGLPSTPASLADSTLIMIDCQNTYVAGVMALDGVAAALDEAAGLLERARSAVIRSSISSMTMARGRSTTSGPRLARSSTGSRHARTRR